MHYRKKPEEEIPQEDTAVWLCTQEGCSGWMRDNFTFDQSPVCWQCNSPMVSSFKLLPLLVNTNDYKSRHKV